MNHRRSGSVCGELDAKRPAELLDPRLADRVRAREGPIHERVDRGDEDHMPAAVDDLRQGRANGPPDAEQVDLDHPFERLRVDRGDLGGHVGRERLGPVQDPWLRTGEA